MFFKFAVRFPDEPSFYEPRLDIWKWDHLSLLGVGSSGFLVWWDFWRDFLTNILMKFFDEFSWWICWQIFLTIFLTYFLTIFLTNFDLLVDFFTYNFLTITSFRIRVPSILFISYFKFKQYHWNKNKNGKSFCPIGCAKKENMHKIYRHYFPWNDDFDLNKRQQTRNYVLLRLPADAHNLKSNP